MPENKTIKQYDYCHTNKIKRKTYKNLSYDIIQ